MAPKRTFGKSTSGPTATPQSNAPSGNGHRYDAAEKIWDGDPMTMSLWFVQTIEDLQDADPKFNRLVESATALTAKGQKIAVLSAEHAHSDLNGTIATGTFPDAMHAPQRSDFARNKPPHSLPDVTSSNTRYTCEDFPRTPCPEKGRRAWGFTGSPLCR